MATKIICYYCQQWHISKQVTQDRRRCEAIGKRIRRKHKACKYFVPTENPIFCRKSGCYLVLMQCLARRRNRLGLNGWAKCKRCRQWDKEIHQIIETYWFLRKRVNPYNPNPDPPKRVIKRRKKVSKRKIKRRPIETKDKPRKIKRRSKPRRKIRRR